MKSASASESTQHHQEEELTTDERADNERAPMGKPAKESTGSVVNGAIAAINADDPNEADVHDAMRVMADAITPATREQVLHMGGVTAVVKGMLDFPESGRISSVGCDALFNEIRGKIDDTTACVFDRGGGRAAVAVLRNLGCEHEHVADSALTLIAEIEKDPSTCAHLEEFGGCVAIVEAMEEFGHDNKTAAEAGCVAISRMAHDAGCVTEMKSLEAGEMLDRLTQTHDSLSFKELADSARAGVGE